MVGFRTGRVRVEGEALAAEVHLLQLALVVPAAVLNRQVDVGAVAAAGVGEDAGGRLPQAHAQLLRRLQCMRAHEVHLQRLVLLRRQLDCTVQQVHLNPTDMRSEAAAGDESVGVSWSSAGSQNLLADV